MTVVGTKTSQDGLGNALSETPVRMKCDAATTWSCSKFCPGDSSSKFSLSASPEITNDKQEDSETLGWVLHDNVIDVSALLVSIRLSDHQKKIEQVDK